MIQPDAQSFCSLARDADVIPMYRRVFSDQLTPVLAYRRLVAEDDREAPSFLLESVEGGERQGRYSFLGAHPAVEIVARQSDVCVHDYRQDAPIVTTTQSDDPLDVARSFSKSWVVSDAVGGLPDAFTGGWIGYVGYDTVRYGESGKLPFDHAPADDRALPDLHLGLYRSCVVFDHVAKVVFAIVWVFVDEHDSVEDAYEFGAHGLDELVRELQTHRVPLPAGSIELDTSTHAARILDSNITKPAFEAMVDSAKEYIRAGDIFQVVLSQRFSRQTSADPFEIYRALRVVNPSPYMIYLQARGSILVASSPEILCRVHDGIVTNRPLAGTRKRGADDNEDCVLADELLADEKERAEHIMLVDLGRNDVGKVCERASVSIDREMEIEYYSHVMHISSTVTGRLRDDLDAWDALRATLPVGTISGAPKIRAMQIIDELEPNRRGPYGGGIGVVSFQGDLDIALALRTMVIPTGKSTQVESDARRTWTVHIQAGAGIVADSIPANEYAETVNKAAALARAIDLAESSFVGF